MHIIEWSSDFALGIDEIDEQHKALVGMINALDASTRGDFSPDSVRRLLDDLNDYVRDHFAFEERLMAGGGCSPELVTRHLGEHAYFRSVLKDLTRDFENERRNVTGPLIEYLVHWLLHHIVVVDLAMAHQLKAAGHDLDKRVAAALLQDVTQGVFSFRRNAARRLNENTPQDLTESERQLPAELRRLNEELERQVLERTRVLSEQNRKLEADLCEMSALVERLRLGQASQGVFSIGRRISGISPERISAPVKA